jgi:hypothetical protein
VNPLAVMRNVCGLGGGLGEGGDGDGDGGMRGTAGGKWGWTSGTASQIHIASKTSAMLIATLRISARGGRGKGEGGRGNEVRCGRRRIEEESCAQVWGLDGIGLDGME